MATTVTYKGETLTTIRNDTKTLKTGGTWVEGDIGITDESGTSVVAVEDVPDSHGGIEKRITAVDISDTDATASDVAQGKVFYSNTGTRTVGTATGGGGESVDPSDYIDMSTTGMDVLYQGQDLEFTGASGSYVDTNISLFSEENINKDFKIVMWGVYVDATIGTAGQADRAFLGAVLERSPYPGILIRSIPASLSAGTIKLANACEYAGVVISRVSGVISVGAVLDTGGISATFNGTNSEQKTELITLGMGSTANAKTTHSTTLTLGCEKDANGTPYRFCSGHIKKVVVAMAS